MLVLVVLSALLVSGVVSHDVTGGKCMNGAVYVTDVMKLRKSGILKGVLTSFGYPITYSSGSDCYFVFYKSKANPAVDVVLQFVDFQADPGKDIMYLTEQFYPGFTSIAPDKSTTITSKIVDGLFTTLTTTANGKIIDQNMWVSSYSGNISLHFTSDAEITAPGFKLKFAFDDCVELDNPEHGEFVPVGKKGKFELVCEDGYKVAYSNAVKYTHDLNFEYDESHYAYCTGNSETARYKWINTGFYCGKILNGCTAPIINNGELVQSELDENKFDVKCNVANNEVRGLQTLTCEKISSYKSWAEFNNDQARIEGYRFPDCVAEKCQKLYTTDEIYVINSAFDYKPGSHIRERCVNNILVKDITRWCTRTGDWTTGIHCNHHELDENGEHLDDDDDDDHHDDDDDDDHHDDDDDDDDDHHDDDDDDHHDDDHDVMTMMIN